VKCEERPFQVGKKVLLHSRGAGRWFPIEKHTVMRISRNGSVFVDGLENVPLKQDGQELEPGAFRFRFYIEIPLDKPRRNGKHRSTKKPQTRQASAKRPPQTTKKAGKRERDVTKRVVAKKPKAQRTRNVRGAR
jgi:hypothetical protein